MKKLYDKIKFIISILILISIFFACKDDDKKQENKKVDKETSTEEVKDKSDKKIKVVFDVPSLMGKNIDQIEKILGEPDIDNEPTKLQIEQGVTIGDKIFIKDGYELLVMYNPQTRKVKDFFIPTTNPSEKTDDYSDLLKIGNLVENDNDYTVRPIITMGDANYYTGIQIREK